LGSSSRCPPCGSWTGACICRQTWFQSETFFCVCVFPGFSFSFSLSSSFFASFLVFCDVCEVSSFAILHGYVVVFFAFFAYLAPTGSS
jgi:DTW domain-containing protein YfiP